MSGPDVERVQTVRFFCKHSCFGDFAESTQYGCPEITRLQTIDIALQGLTEMSESTLEFQSPAFYFREVVVRRRLPRVVPSRLVVSGICFLESLLILQRQAEIVVCVAFGRIGVSPCLPLNRMPKVCFSFRELAAF